MSAGRWKRHEREIAATLGGVRLPNTGQGQPAVITDDLAVQVKTRKRLPAWVHSAVDQAEQDADGGQLPAVVLAEAVKGRRTRRYLVVDLDRLLRWPDCRPDVLRARGKE